MESRLLFLVIIMMIKIIPAVFITVVPFIKFLQVLYNGYCGKTSVAAIIYYFFILSLSSHLNFMMYLLAFQLTSLYWKRLATFSITHKVFDCCHYIDLDLLSETQRNPNSEGPRQTV